MAKPKVKEVIVVEGRYDKNTLSQVVDAVIVELGGFAVFNDKEKQAFLRKLAMERGIILFADPDGAGFVIRNRVKGNIPEGRVLQAYVPDIYGKEDYAALCARIYEHAQSRGVAVECFQSNHEGDLIDEIQSAAGRADGIILNPGGYAHYSVAILDALRLCGVPAVEVLLSEPDEHEPFRKTDIVSFGCQGRFAGEGIGGYLHACSYLVQLLRLDGGAQSHMVQ